MSNHDREMPGTPARKDNQQRHVTRRAWIGVAMAGTVIALGGNRWWRWANASSGAVKPTAIVVYASPSCACCHAWMIHLDASGFQVSKELVMDVTPHKRKFFVPEQLWSCHTAIVDGYVFEGHVPADVIRKVLADRPAFVGVAVPGMPSGAPGMEGGGVDKYDVISFTRSGETLVYVAG